METDTTVGTGNSSNSSNSSSSSRRRGRGGGGIGGAGSRNNNVQDFGALRKPLGIALCVAIILQICFSYFESYYQQLKSTADAERSKNGMLPADESFERYCTDIDMIRYIQKNQLKTARLEIFGSDHKIFDGEQHLFYDHDFGSVEVRALQGDTPVAALVYYTIWKAGNDNIRAHLDAFGSKCNHSKVQSDCSPVHIKSLVTKEHRLCIDHCYVDKSHQGYVNHQAQLDAHEQHKSKNPHYMTTRFPFTFVRDPLQRFVSGYTETEYRLEKNVNNVMFVPLYQKVGTAERFREFIQMILRADASKRHLHSKYHELPHIAPQIGVFLKAQQVEGIQLHQYKLEDFENEYKRLAEESGFLGLMDVYSREQLMPHETSKDPRGTTKAAYAFLNLSLVSTPVNTVANLSATGVDTDAKKAAATATVVMIDDDIVAGDVNVSALNISVVEQDMLKLRRSQTAAKQSSATYLRALCRIYLADYMCTGYDLPAMCSDLAAEYRLAAEEYKEQNKHFLLMHSKEKTWKTHVYYYLLFIYAEIDCFFESNPQCVTDIMYGKDSGIDVD
jgi:hypothetical protein